MVDGIVDVVTVEVVADRLVRLAFEDGLTAVVDLAEMLWGDAFAAHADDGFFAQVCVDQGAGTIVWPDGSDLSPHTLYVHALAAARGDAA